MEYNIWREHQICDNAAEVVAKTSGTVYRGWIAVKTMLLLANKNSVFNFAVYFGLHTSCCWIDSESSPTRNRPAYVWIQKLFIAHKQQKQQQQQKHQHQEQRKKHDDILICHRLRTDLYNRNAAPRTPQTETDIFTRKCGAFTLTFRMPLY